MSHHLRRAWLLAAGWFRFGPGGGEMISMTSRPDAAAFFTDVDREVSPTEPDFGVLLGVASSHGLTVLLPARLLPASQPRPASSQHWRWLRFDGKDSTQAHKRRDNSKK